MHFRCLRKFPADLHSHALANSGVYTCISDACGSFRLIYIPMSQLIPDRTNAFRILAEVFVSDTERKVQKCTEQKKENKTILEASVFEYMCHERKVKYGIRVQKYIGEKKKTKIQNGRHEQRSGQHTLACQKSLKTKQEKPLGIQNNY
jgi:hypothetical protein